MGLNAYAVNLKELRFDAADGVWRVAFAFDPTRRAVPLVAGDKAGQSTRRFYLSSTDQAVRRSLRCAARQGGGRWVTSLAAMGGELDLVARFPNRPPVRLKALASASEPREESS